MNILLTNHHCFNFGGTENYTVDLARTLMTLGHNVDIFIATTQEKMPAFDYFKKKFPDLTWVFKNPPPDKYDLLLINHNTTLEKVKDYKGYKIYTSHGLPGLEIPKPGADHYVFISNELFNRYPDIKNKSVIKTGFFTNEFEEFPYQENLNNPTCLLIDYTPTSISSDNFMNVCKRLNVWSEVFNEKRIDPFVMRQLYKGFDIICATGRTALEAILHGKRVIVYGHFGCDGRLEKRYEESNYSGRYTNSLDCFETELVRTLQQSEKEFRKIQNKIKDTRDIFVSAESYLQLCKERTK